jgi:hypothetical protein
MPPLANKPARLISAFHRSTPFILVDRDILRIPLPQSTVKLLALGALVLPAPERMTLYKDLSPPSQRPTDGLLQNLSVWPSGLDLILSDPIK